MDNLDHQTAKWKYGPQPSLLVGHVPTGGAVSNDYVRVVLSPEGRLEVVPITDEDNPVVTDEKAFTQAEDQTDVSLATPSTATQLPNVPCKAVLIVSPITNGATLTYWGFSNTSADKPIAVGGHVLLPVANANMVWVSADAPAGSDPTPILKISTMGPD